MKYRTTAKQIRENYSKNRILSLGYCEAQFLLAPFSPDAYTCGVYGWNFDVYEIDGVAICTGYRGMPNGMDYDYSKLRELEEKARNVPYGERKATCEKLLTEFIEECIFQNDSRRSKK